MKKLLAAVAVVSAVGLVMSASSASAAPGDLELESPEFRIIGSCGGGTFNSEARFATHAAGEPTSDADFDVNVGSGIAPSFWMFYPTGNEVYHGVTVNFLVAGSDIEVDAGDVPRNPDWSLLATAPEYVITEDVAGTVVEISTPRLRIAQYNMDCTIAAGNGLIGLYVNQAPALTDDAASTDFGVPVTIDVLANDDATWDSGIMSSTNPTAEELATQDHLEQVPAESLAVALAVAALPSNGTVAVGADGAITYTPEAGFTGTDSFAYTLTDNDGATSEATVTVEVLEQVVEPPTIERPTHPVPPTRVETALFSS